MMFTFCLVTKGRRDYLPATLESLKAALSFADVNIIVIDNGCPVDVSNLLNQWCSQFDDRAKYLRFDVNETAATRVWSALRNMNIDWITFPGDDDVINPKFLESLKGEIKKNPNLVAVAASLRVIDSTGGQSGEIRRPAKFDGVISSYLAGALSEPPFLFPGLFFKFGVIEGEIPSSRYVFDWWLALNLIISGAIMTTSEIAIDYRVHEGQESALAPKRRKYFEAQIVLSRFVNSSNFETFISELSPDEIYVFWLGLVKSKPIYQNREFGNYLLTQIGEKLAGCISDEVIANQILSELASINGVLLRKGEISSLSNRERNSATDLHGNFKLVSVDDSCPILKSLISETNLNSELGINIVLGCKHSRKHSDFVANCQVKTENEVAWLDNLIVEITEDLESSGKLTFTLTPYEKLLISKVRGMRNRIPSVVLNKFKRFVMPSGGIK